MATSYETASAKLGPIKSETKSISKEVFDAAKAAGHEVWYMWGYDANVNNPEHHSGLALDFMVRNSKAGDWIRNYIWSNRDRLRLRHVIWSQHITSTVTSPGSVRKMADRGSVTENHMDHVHALFFAGAYLPKNNSSTPPNTGSPSKTVAQLAKEVISGIWGNGSERVSRLNAAGYDAAKVQAEVDKLMGAPAPAKKTTSQLAKEVIAGKWGNGDARVKKLKEAGYNPTTVQKEVDRLLSVPSKKTTAQLAKEVIAGKWGVGADRVTRLTKAGYNASAVQKEVNRLMK